MSCLQFKHIINIQWPCTHMTNYISKGTQEDDSESYRRLINSVKRWYTYQIHEIDFSESLSQILSCVFAHTRAHIIISAPIANYLIRNKSCFHFSHNFEFVPIKTVSRIINDAPFLLQVCQQGKCIHIIVILLIS